MNIREIKLVNLLSHRSTTLALPSEGVVLVEWAERLAGELPDERLEIVFGHEAGDRRRLEFVPFGERFHCLLRDMFPASRSSWADSC